MLIVPKKRRVISRHKERRTESTLQKRGLKWENIRKAMCRIEGLHMEASSIRMMFFLLHSCGF